MSFNISNFVNSFINKINGNKTNSNNNSNTNNINNSTLFNYKETPDVEPKIKMSGMVVVPTPTPQATKLPDRPMTGIVVAPTPTPTVEIMPDRPMTGIVAAPPQDTTPTTPQKPKLPSIFGKIFSGNSIFSKINNIFTSIFRRF